MKLFLGDCYIAETVEVVDNTESLMSTTSASTAEGINVSYHT